MILAVLVLLVTCSEDGPQQTTVILTEWVVPWEASRPRDPYVENENKIWFVGQGDGYLAYFNPAIEEFTKIQLAEGSAPHNIIVDDNGVAWYAGNVMGWIGRFAPDGGLITIQMPEDAADPHTLIEDSEGFIWFTSQGANSVGMLDKVGLTVRIFPVPTPDARPYGITLDDDGRPWIALFGTNKIATIDPEVGTFTEINLPRTNARPRRIETTSDGMVWYVDYAGGYLGRYDPDDEDFKEWAMPSGNDARPYAMAVDAKDRIWFVEVGPQPNRFIGFDPDDESFFSVTEIESGGGAVRHMNYHAPTNTIWFGTDANTLGRAELPD